MYLFIIECCTEKNLVTQWAKNWMTIKFSWLCNSVAVLKDALPLSPLHHRPIFASECTETVWRPGSSSTCRGSLQLSRLPQIAGFKGWAQSRRKPECRYPIIWLSHFNEHPSLSFPFILPLFNSKSTVLLITGSGLVLVYYIQRWCHHVESGRAGIGISSWAERAKNILIATMLKI